MNKNLRKFLSLALAMMMLTGTLGMAAAEGVGTPSDLPPVESAAPAMREEPTEAAPIETAAPVETAAPTEVPAATAAPTEAPAETAVPVETAAPIEAPAETATPAEASAETAAPVETSAPTEASAETAAPVTTEAAAETTAPVEAPAETEAPVTTGIPAETAAPTEAPIETAAPIENNASETPETCNLYVTVVWKDNGNEQGIRPEALNVSVTGNDGSKVTASVKDRPQEGEDEKSFPAHDVWKEAFLNLPKLANGAEIQYSVQANAPQGYKAEVNGLTVNMILIETEAPVEIEAPTETETPAETEAPVETEVPVETEAPVEAEAPTETEAPVETEVPVETEAPAETEAPVEEIARSVDVFASWEGDALYFGDEMTLTAVLHGYENMTYHLQWQVSADGTAWTDVAGETGTTTTVLVTEENYLNYWRVLVIVTDANATDAE